MLHLGQVRMCTLVRVLCRRWRTPRPRRLTELRRRTEERLDWKRMYGELQFDDLDDERLWDDDQIRYQYDAAEDMLDD